MNMRDAGGGEAQDVSGRLRGTNVRRLPRPARLRSGRPLTKSWRCCRAALLACLIVTLPAGPARAEVTAEAAREAVRRAVNYLLDKQDAAQGSWADYSFYKGGATALCTLALLNAGLPADDPRMAAALNYLRKIGNPEKTYCTALQTMVFALAEPERDRLLIRRNVAWLESTQVPDEKGRGGWTYDDRRSGTPDNSNSQFALLALNEAQRAGVPVDRRVWERAVQYWETRQLPDGSWGYRSNRGKGSMTCAGISSLIIARRNLSQGDALVLDDGQVICCGSQQDDLAIRRGLDWMTRNFSVDHNPSADPSQQTMWLYYYLYGLERVGRLSGSRFLGQHDWYREGAEFLVQQQNLNGQWSYSQFIDNPHITTALGLLFLAKGRRPVLISKLRHLPDEDWNRHRQDIGNLTRHVETLWRQDMTWQVIDFTQASVEDLLQSPIIFLSGRDGLTLSPAQTEALRQYVLQGGFLFAEACCGGAKFDRDFRQLMAELFPDSPLRLLPPDHPIWYAEQAVDPQRLRPLFGLDTCCRTSVAYCPDNLGCFWELARAADMGYPDAVQADIDAVLAIGANVVAYATNRQLRDKLDTPAVILAEGETGFVRGTLRIPKLAHSGGSDEAPAALANLLRGLGQQMQLRVDTQRLILPATHDQLPDYPLLFFHGRRDFSWSAEEAAAVRSFVTHGGVLFGDAICGSEEFARAARREINALFPDSPLRRIPPDHPLFSDQFHGFALQQVQLNKPRMRDDQGLLQRRTEAVTPYLEGVEIDGRFVVIFSPWDLSCALESPAVTDCHGYVSDDALRIGINVVLYALQQ